MVKIVWQNRENKKYLDQLQAWRTGAEARLQKQLPKLDAGCSEVLASACRAVQSADQSHKDAQQVLEQLQNAKTKDAAAIQAASRALEDATQALEDATTSCMNVAVDAVLDRDESIRALLSQEFNDSDLLLYTALNGNCKDIARWIDQNEAWAGRVMAGLQNAELLRLFHESGGPRNAKYGPAIKNYHELCTDQAQKDKDDNGVLQRLALACALELADPYELFGKRGFTDAKKRYVHYEQAYLWGELDPHFSQFNVWELRQVVNSDAPEEELSWGRQSLQNYRPDIVLMSNNPQWQYCFIVRTDVGYRTPDWYRNPHSYDQILSGGGKCGPRAWYGRFACKAFGVPTWGCRQPGHAAMLRWTPPDGDWCACLGGGIWKSWWGDQAGSDFLLEATARRACASEREFLQKVLRLQLVSAYYKEDVKTVRTRGLPDPKNLWQSLDMMQRRRLGATSNEKKKCGGKPTMYERGNIDRNRIAQTQALHDAGAISGDPVSRDAGTIVIPASSCSSPGPRQKKVAFLPSFSGGRQLLVQQDAEVEFTLRAADAPPGSYQLACRVCTVHRSEQPILLTVVTDGRNDPSTVHAVNMPYTVGMWQDTEPVTIEIGAATTATKLHFARPKQQYGFSFKEVRLTPV